MALKDKIPFGMALPHRTMDPLNLSDIRDVAQRAEALGFSDLWVTENTLDNNYSVDPMVVLTYAAALTHRIGLGVAVVVLPVHHAFHAAHQAVSLDFVSNGRAILGVGLGRVEDYNDFQVSTERRVRRFKEQIDVMKALWTQNRVTYEGHFYTLKDTAITLKSPRKPHMRLWLGGSHPDAVTRAATLGTGWIGAGGTTKEGFTGSVAHLRTALEKAGVAQSSFTISKRVFMAVEEKPGAAREQMLRWCTDVYRNPGLIDNTGAVYGTPEQCREKIESLIAAGANHLLLNPVAQFPEQLEAIAEVVGFG